MFKKREVHLPPSLSELMAAAAAKAQPAPAAPPKPPVGPPPRLP
jgi:hypothetical protein